MKKHLIKKNYNTMKKYYNSTKLSTSFQPKFYVTLPTPFISGRKIFPDPLFVSLVKSIAKLFIHVPNWTLTCFFDQVQTKLIVYYKDYLLFFLTFCEELIHYKAKYHGIKKETKNDKLSFHYSKILLKLGFENLEGP